MLEEHVGRAIEENDKGFDEFCGRNLCFAWTNHANGRPNVPGPAVFSETAHPAGQCEQAVPEKDSSFDTMRKTVVDVVSSKDTSVGHNTAQDKDKPDDEDEDVHHVVEKSHDFQQRVRHDASQAKKKAVDRIEMGRSLSAGNTDLRIWCGMAGALSFFVLLRRLIIDAGY